MAERVAGPEIERLIQLLARLPGLGPRSARRAALHLIRKREELLGPLAESMRVAHERIVTCSGCGNIDTSDPCAICADLRRDASTLIVVETVADLWALERAQPSRARYHVLGGVLSPINGITADKLRIAELGRRLDKGGVKELILGLGASAEAETTCLYLARIFAGRQFKISLLARGVPAGTELEYIDQLTLNQALHERNEINYESRP